MQVFGDAMHSERASHKVEAIRELMHAARLQAPGVQRHSALAFALLEAGELLQAVSDSRFNANGQCDGPSAAPEIVATTALTIALARRCAASWISGFERCLAEPVQLLDACEAMLSEESFSVKQPEGYAFYAIYPEAYFMAAARFVALTGCGVCRVVGLRSIGTSLGAMVAAAVGETHFTTLRPVGHPFRRRLSVSGRWPEASPEVCHAVVDEGPGLSGSSMAAVVRHLRASGCAAERIHLFPGHAGGPGAHATDEVRSLWATSNKHIVDFDDLILHATSPHQRLRAWVEQVVGPLRVALEDVSGPRWRSAHSVLNALDAPVHPWQERRKFLAYTAHGAWLVKFGGLGLAARRRFECARMLGDAGLCPQVAGWCHGFLIERWHDDMTPLKYGSELGGGLRERLLQAISKYIAYRARHFPMPQAAGASLAALNQMARSNSAEAFGAAFDASWKAHLGLAQKLHVRVQPVRTDNRMHAWEWLERQNRFLKTDAIDHHAGHDLIGCQDPAWDVAGGVVEFDLSARERELLLEGLRALECNIDPELLCFYIPAYMAFQLGHFRLAARDAADAIERERLARHAECAYERPLRAWLEKGGGAA